MNHGFSNSYLVLQLQNDIISNKLYEVAFYRQILIED